MVKMKDVTASLRRITLDEAQAAPQIRDGMKHLLCLRDSRDSDLTARPVL
jgi:hypothetical protein